MKFRIIISADWSNLFMIYLWYVVCGLLITYTKGHQ